MQLHRLHTLLRLSVRMALHLAPGALQACWDPGLVTEACSLHFSTIAFQSSKGSVLGFLRPSLMTSKQGFCICKNHELYVSQIPSTQKAGAVLPTSCSLKRASELAP